MKNYCTYETEDKALPENAAREMYVQYCAEMSGTRVARHQKMFSLESLHCFHRDDYKF